MENKSQVSRNARFLIVEGGKIGRLSIGPIVYDIRNHPLFVETNISYIRQGRLRECYCDCGSVKLIAERILETGRVLSCGCFKREKSAQKVLRDQAEVDSAEARKRLTREIRSAQYSLRWHQAQPLKDENKIEQIGTRIRELILKKLTTINFQKNAKARIRRNNRKLLIDLNLVPDRDHEQEEQSEPGKA